MKRYLVICLVTPQVQCKKQWVVISFHHFPLFTDGLPFLLNGQRCVLRVPWVCTHCCQRYLSPAKPPGLHLDSHRAELTSESCNGQATPEQSQRDELEGAAVPAFPKTLGQRSQSLQGMSLAQPGHAFVLAIPYAKHKVQLDQHLFHTSYGPSFASLQVRDVMNSVNC